MRERGCERGESDGFTLFLIKDQDVGISGEEVEVKSGKTEFRVIPGQKSGYGETTGRISVRRNQEWRSAGKSCPSG